MKKSDYTSYICGRIEAQLEGFAISAGIPKQELAGNVGTFLLSTSSRKELGTSDSMSTLPKQTTKRSKASPKVEMVKRTYSKPQKHWTQTPAGREKMRQRMKRYWREGKFANS